MQIRRKVILFLIILCCYCCNTFTEASGDKRNEINLNRTCTGEHLYACTISGLSPSFDAPFTLAGHKAPQLRELVLYNCMLRVLPTEVFRLAPNLTTLFMQNCGVFRLNSEDFHAAGQLRQLVLQKNRLSKLIDKQFSMIPNLQMLELGYNIIHTVHKEAFWNLTQLRYLGLQFNGIRSLMDGVLAPLLNLEHIDLSGNEIEKIDGETFQNNHNLRTLLLNNNPFIVFEPNSLIPLNHIRLLDLSNSAVEELLLQSVETLLVQGSGLKRLVIKDGVIKLHASNNELTQVSIGDKLAVIELDLHSNQLAGLELVQGMVNLQRLDLSKNKIQSLRVDNLTTYLPLLSLTNLNLASNQLNELTAENLLLLPRLTHLDISFNHLLRLNASIFEPLINLEKFYIEGNRLHEFNYESFLRNHAHLKEVGLCDNEWEFHFMRKMVTYLGDHGVHMPARYTKQSDATKSGSITSKNLHQHMPTPQTQAQVAGVSGIHPYWTTRDILALTTLIVVFLIMLLQMYQLLREDGCFRRCRAWHQAHFHSNLNGVGRTNRPSRLNEEDSETSTSE